MPSSLVTSFLGALQASLSILLVISYGVIAAQFGWLKDSSAKEISKICVRMFLPALLITNVGSQLHLQTAIRYLPILIWSLTYTLISMLLGIVATRFLKLPSWTTPAVTFNNTTALPLLLIQSLEATGILNRLLMSKTDTSSAAVNRAKSYFLVCAIVSNSLTFSLGPKLLDGEESPDEASNESNPKRPNEEVDGYGTHDVEAGREQQNDHIQQTSGDEETEEASLLPDRAVRGTERVGRKSYYKGKEAWDKLPPWVQSILDFLYSFCNAPVIGAIIGAIIGLAPPLHKAFFNDPEDGGFFKAWLTSSVQNIGELFTALQVVVVGVKLSGCLRKLKKGEESGYLPWPAVVFVLITRFVVWPMISIAVIYFLASRTSWLSNDPILWFTMMLMPTGPPAMKLTALADVNGSNQKEKLSIAKFLTLAYILSPIICFTVVGSLKASETAMLSR